MKTSRNAIVKAALILAAACGNGGLISRFHHLDTAVEVGVYLASFSVLLCALILASDIESRPARWSWGAVLSISFFLCESYRRVTGQFLDYPSFIQLLGSANFASEALSQFSGPILLSALNGLVLFLGIVLAPAPSRRWNRRIPAAAPVAAAGILFAALFVRGGRGADGLPPAFTPLAYGGLLAYEELSDGAKAKRTVEIPRGRVKIDHDIIFIIDESVRGDYLDINRPLGVHSGLKTPIAGASIYNFGLAASATNCSLGTNVTFRFGGTRDNYREVQKTMPSIWQYAKGAGLETVYIDAQRTGGALSNQLTKKDLKYIDRFIQFDGVPVVQRDMKAERVVAELAADGVPKLIVVNKVGAHFPVADKFPDDFMKYEPAQPRGRYPDVAWLGPNDGVPRAWNLYKNSYKNTLAWNVGMFFDRLIKDVDFNKAVVLYTSDHGQNFRERGEPGLSTHCNANPSIEEGVVPLVVIAGSRVKTLDWRGAVKANFNRASHYEVFPTLLALMGYDRAGVEKVYGPTLAEKSADPFTFNARFEARFRLQPVWVKIDLAKVIGPTGGEDYAARRFASLTTHDARRSLRRGLVYRRSRRRALGLRHRQPADAALGRALRHQGRRGRGGRAALRRDRSPIY